jgi:hypothetical protein
LGVGTLLVTSLVEQPTEAMHVHPVGVDIQHITAGAANHPRGFAIVTAGLSEDPSQAGDVDVQGMPYAIWWLLPPHAVNHGVEHHRPARVYGKGSQHPPLPWRPDIQQPAGCPHLHRSQQAKLQHNPVPRTSPGNVGSTTGTRECAYLAH